MGYLNLKLKKILLYIILIFEDSLKFFNGIKVYEISKPDYEYESKKYFKCLLDNFYVNSKYACDGHFDCFDKSDEQNCNDFQDNAFHCLDGKQVIGVQLVCDFVNDCEDESDELYCSKIQIFLVPYS